MTMSQRMLRPGRMRSWPAIRLAALVATALLCLSAAWAGAATQSATSAEPWTAANTVRPADLVHELASSTGTGKPVVVCTAPAFLYRNGHVPGASLHGPASTEQGLSALKRWAQGLSRSTNLVVYCGCCPLDRCPNLRPAFEALREMGFTRLRVLILPNNFGIDWVQKGYPVEKTRAGFRSSAGRAHGGRPLAALAALDRANTAQAARIVRTKSRLKIGSNPVGDATTLTRCRHSPCPGRSPLRP